MDDRQLLDAYANNGSEAAFEAIVRRRVNLVFSAALRQVRDPGAAGEVTQIVFIILARKARLLPPGTVLTGWLYRTTQFTARRALRTECRRREREQEAARMNTETTEPTDPIWQQMAPLLEEGMARLGDADRNALLLRYFENRSLRDLGTALGTSEDTAQKRVSRAVEKLRVFFAKRGVILSAVVIPAALSAHAVQAAPAGIVSVSVLKGATASVSTTTLLHETLRWMTWMQLKNGAIVGAGVVLAAAAASLTVREAVQGREPDFRGEPLTYWLTGYDTPQGGLAWRMADAAVLAAGTNAIPTLLRMYRESDSALGQVADGQTAFKRVSAVSAGIAYPGVPAGAALRHHLEASFAFQALGAVASNAVPALIPIFQENYFASPAVHHGILEAIGGIGPAARDAVPALLSALPVLPEEDHANVFFELGKIHSQPGSVLPVLIAALQDPSVPVRNSALFALGQYGPDANSAVPAIQQLAGDASQDQRTLNLAAQALRQIATANARDQNRGNSQ